VASAGTIVAPVATLDLSPLTRLRVPAAEVQPPHLLGAVQSDTLGRSLLIALVVVSPYAIHKWMQVRRVRDAHERVIAADAAASEPTRPRPPALEDVIRDVGLVLAEATEHGGAMLLIPTEVTVSDRAASDEVVDVLVRDALRRSGLVVTAELDTAEGRLLECTLIGGTPRR
jgi:hypothetical protein